jgi:hypothetical protein
MLFMLLPPLNTTLACDRYPARYGPRVTLW